MSDQQIKYLIFLFKGESGATLSLPQVMLCLSSVDMMDLDPSILLQSFETLTVKINGGNWEVFQRQEMVMDQSQLETKSWLLADIIGIHRK